MVSQANRKSLLLGSKKDFAHEIVVWTSPSFIVVSWISSRLTYTFSLI